MKNTKKNIWKRWYMIVAYCFIGLVVLGVLFGEAPVEDSQKQIVNDVGNEELIYSNTIGVYLESTGTVAFTMADVLGYVSDGTFTFAEGAYLFGESEEFFKLLEDELNSMNVPSKFTKFHKHFTNSIRYSKEASSLTKEGLLNFDIDDLEKSNVKIELAISEMSKATNMLNTLV